MSVIKYTGKLFAIGFCLLAGTIAINAQCPTVMPAGTFCLTQAEANVAASNARENIALKKEVEVLKGSLADKDESIKQLKDANTKNVLDLTNQNTKLTADYATAQGQLIEANANNTRQLAIIDVLLKNTRKKCLPFSVCIN